MTELLRIAKPSALPDPVVTATVSGLGALDSVTALPVVLAEASEQLV